MNIRAIACFVLLICLSARAADTSALIAEQLDKIQPRIELDAVLPKAMRAIEEQTAVPVRAQPVVWDLLPWGEQTNIKATIENKTLRDALDAITRTLGLTFVLEDDAITLHPMPALLRLGRRSTVQELDALNQLATSSFDGGGEKMTLGALAEAIDKKLVDLKLPVAVENRAGSAARQDQPVFVPRGATLLEALESIHHDTGATWYPWGRSIVIISKEDQVRKQLSRAVTTRYNGVDITQVLNELATQSHVDFAIEPGAVQRIPPEFRTVRLVLDNASIQQALENIAGFTGLGYIVSDKGVYIWNQSATPPAARDPILGMIPLDSGMQVIVPQSQVPPDVREYVKHKTQQQLEKIRAQMREEGFMPTSQPAPTTQTSEDL